jgi:DNA repair protein RecN (Recombination protein N)
MLRFLRIRNLAVIEAAEVEFESGFNVLTGETGAGKSILVEAVGLLLGGRSSADLIRTGESHAVIEAMFEHDGDEVVVRRELTSHGRSRSFINGTLATAGALRDLSARLAELHGQHEHQALLDPLTHLSVLDEYADLAPLIERVGAAWAELRTIRDQVDRSRMDARERSARLELVAFQLGEIEKVAPRAGEDEALKVRREVLASAERIQRLCQESYAALYERDEAALATLGGVWKRVGELATLDPQFLPYIDARDGIKAQLEDLALFLRGYADGVDASPGRLQEVEERLALLDRLKRKYGPRLEDVLARGRALACERDQLGGAGARTEDLLRLLQQAERQYLDVARELSARRHEAAGRFGQRIEAMLAELAMERTRFEVRFDDGETRADQWGERGLDRAEFYLSPNLGEEMRPLARIVSGGELSRIMLALKTLAVGDAPHKTLIFDEVDAGIGGRVAEVVGRRLRELGDRFQVLCITHLPQIAARGEAHFRIEKQARGGRTTTSVARLADAERVDEIARMIAGARVTDAVQVTAYDLLRVRPAAKAKGESERRKR